MPDWQPVAGHRHQHLHGRQAGSLGPWHTLTQARLVGSSSYGSWITLRKQPPSVSFTGKAVTPSSTGLQVLELTKCDRSLVPPLTGFVSATELHSKLAIRTLFMTLCTRTSWSYRQRQSDSIMRQSLTGLEQAEQAQRTPSDFNGSGQPGPSGPS